MAAQFSRERRMRRSGFAFVCVSTRRVVSVTRLQLVIIAGTIVQRERERDFSRSVRGPSVKSDAEHDGRRCSALL